jgi:hypothetical protein
MGMPGGQMAAQITIHWKRRVIISGVIHSNVINLSEFSINHKQ